MLARIKRSVLWLLLGTYVLGAWLPAPGLALRNLRHAAHLGNATIELSVPVAMLGFLLVVAALGTNLAELRRVLGRPTMLLVGLIANAAFPIVFTVALSLLLRAWHDADEAQNILVGLALIGAMPIAGSSTAWSQNGEGRLALSLGLVLGSTLLSPLVTPLGLHAVGLVTHGDYAEDLHELAQAGSTSFVAIAVVAPTVLGLVLRGMLGAARVERALPTLKALNLVVLLTLNYANAAVALPQVVRQPDWDFAALIALITASLCIASFAVGWALPRAFRAERADQTAMMFGLGMNNNGTGLVLASQALADHPLVMLPIIFYNLTQQIVAGVVDRIRRVTEDTP
jgi:BASS family bile acid:Na+ symporter